MKAFRIAHSSFAVLCALVALAAASALTPGCGGSEVTEFDPTQVLANFSVYRQSVETPDALEVEAIATNSYGGAIFYQGLSTLRLDNTVIEVIDPAGQAHAMAPLSSPTGQFYYSVELPDLQLNSQYTFRVTLFDGIVIANSITTPQNDLAITLPALDADIVKNENLQVTWTGTNAGRNVTAAIRNLTTPDIFTVYGVIGVVRSDVGATVLTPASQGMDPNDTGVGTRLLTVTRRNDQGVNGFVAGSLCRAALISARQVNVTEPTL